MTEVDAMEGPECSDAFGCRPGPFDRHWMIDRAERHHIRVARVASSSCWISIRFEVGKTDVRANGDTNFRATSLLLFWKIAKCLVSLIAVRDEIPLQVKMSISINKRLTSVAGYTWELWCYLTIFHHFSVLLLTSKRDWEALPFKISEMSSYDFVTADKLKKKDGCLFFWPLVF